MAVFETGNPQTTSSIEHATQSSQMAGSIPIFCRMVLLKSVLFRLKSQCFYIYIDLCGFPVFSVVLLKFPEFLNS